MKRHPLDETNRVTKRFVMALLGCGMVFWFLKTHRDWCYAYFAAMMQMPQPLSPELAAVAKESIAAITTIAISGISAVSFIAAWFITGSVVALSNMFRFGTASQVMGSVEAAVQDIHERRDEKIEVIRAPKAEHFDGEDIP